MCLVTYLMQLGVELCVGVLCFFMWVSCDGMSLGFVRSRTASCSCPVQR